MLASFWTPILLFISIAPAGNIGNCSCAILPSYPQRQCLCKSQLRLIPFSSPQPRSWGDIRRSELGVLQRSVKRPKLTTVDRLLWAWLWAAWADWQPKFHHYEVGHADRLASQKIPPVLDLEDSARKAGATGGPGGCPIFDWYDEPGQPALGRTADSRRTAQAWHCRRRNEREQVHGPQPSAASAWIT